MNRRFSIRAPWVSRVLILGGFAAAVSLAACEEKLEAGAACPILCAQPNVALKDTIVEAIGVDSSLSGFPPIGEESPLLLAARGDTLDTRVIFRFDTLPKTFPHPGAAGDTIVTHVDSATLRIVLDTSTIVGVPGLPTSRVTIELYDVDSDAARDTVAADLLPLFSPSRLIGSKSFAPESLAKDTLLLPVSAATVLSKVVNGARLRIGLRLMSSASTQLRILSSGAPATLRFKPATDTAVNVALQSSTPSDTSLATLRTNLEDYVITAKGVIPPPLTVSVGGYSGRRTYMRFDLPSHIVDSSTVVRATLTLTQFPMRNSAGALDSVGIYPFPITAGAIVTDIPRLLRLVSVTTLGAVDSLKVVPADSGARRLELVNIVRVWRNTRAEQTQRALVLVLGEEGINPAIAAFFSSEADSTLRPRLQLTYVPTVTLGLP
jgi:hypothetical protein